MSVSLIADTFRPPIPHKITAVTKTRYKAADS
jgi:hypothetical protein